MTETNRQGADGKDIAQADHGATAIVTHITVHNPSGDALAALLPRTGRSIHLPQRPPLFIGRQTELEALHQRLQQEGSLAYVTGIGGRGKTTLVLQYAHLYQHGFEAVHWLPCQRRSLTQIAAELTFQLGLQPEGDLDAILHEITSHCARRRSLLILDNVDDEHPERLIPGGHASVLITTRHTNLRFLRLHKPLDLPLFTEEQCFELFRDVVGQAEVDRHTSEARALFERLGRLPIAIAIAASLIREDARYTIAGMAKRLPADVIALLTEAIAALSPAAQTLLRAMAACAPAGFRLSLAAQIGDFDEETSLEALHELRARSLAEELDRDTLRYRLHTLVREAAGATPEQSKNHAEAVQRQFKKWQSDWKQCEADMADWQTAFTWSLAQPEDDRWSLANDLAFQGYALTKQLGRLPEAFEVCERMLTEAARRESPNTVQAWYGNQALILQAWGQLEEAMALHKKEEAFCIELANKDGLQACYGNQAVILQAWGQLDDAMALLRKKEDLCKELGSTSSLAYCYYSWGLLAREQGDRITEKQKLEQALTLLKKLKMPRQIEAVQAELDKTNGAAPPA